MGYVQNSLLPQETVVYSGRVHWALLVPGLVSVVLGIALFSAPSVVPVLQHPAFRMFIWLGSAFLVLTGTLHVLQAAFKRMTTELALTNKRIISRSGFIRREILELWYTKIESVVVDQSILGMMFGYGSLYVNGVGGHRSGVHDIENPMAFRMKAMEMIDGVQSPQQQSK